jgi:beta-glucosidase
MRRRVSVAIERTGLTPPVQPLRRRLLSALALGMIGTPAWPIAKLNEYHCERGSTSTMSEDLSPSLRLSAPKDSAMWRPDFVFGTATAAFQIEGANQADGRLPSIWDTFSATPGKVLNGDTGAVACDHYHRWQDDIDLVADLGFDAYRLSIAWPRVMHQDGTPNAKGVDFYVRLLERIQQKGLKAFVTLYHWDLPQHLEDRGGWLNRDTAYRFVAFADLMSRALAGKVAAWATFNEPWVSAQVGYGDGHHAPGLADPRFAMQAMHHMLLAHGMAVPVLRRNDPSAQVGIVLDTGFGEAASAAPADQHALRLFNAHRTHWVMDPLFKQQYPDDLWELFPGAQPLVLAGDMACIGADLDYIGFNYYMRNVLESDSAHGYRYVEQPGVERTQMNWEVYPDGLRQLLVRFDELYDNLPPVYITENGMAWDDRVVDGAVDDPQRVSYITRHLAAIDQAMRQGVDVRGYFAWSMLDNFEWAMGYARRFGIVHVDYATQVRTPKTSALEFEKFLHARAALAGNDRSGS